MRATRGIRRRALVGGHAASPAHTLPSAAPRTRGTRRARTPESSRSMKHALTACLLACLVSGCASTAPEKLRQQGYELLAAGRIDEAGAVLEHPGLEHDVVARLLRAEAAFRAGDHDAAIARYRTLVAGELSHAMRTLALHNLAASLSASGRSDEA
jgi:hypothetical protein